MINSSTNKYLYFAIFVFLKSGKLLILTLYFVHDNKDTLIFIYRLNRVMLTKFI